MNGGIIVTLGNSSSVLCEAGLSNRLGKYNAGSLFHPGSVVTVKVRASDNPVTYGYPDVFPVFRGNGSLLDVARYDRDLVVLQYGTEPAKDEIEYKGPVLGQAGSVTGEDTAIDPVKADAQPYVLSGMVRNEDEIIGQGAIFDVPVGSGKLIAFTFDPLHRYLNLHDASLVWNVLINWDYLGKVK